MDQEQTASEIVAAALRIHRSVGPGLLEAAYEAMLEYELLERGLAVERQKYVSLQYRRLDVERAYCLDLLVNESVIVEVKSLEHIAPVHMKQVLTYLKLTGLSMGFLINFGQTTLKAGLRRLVYHYVPQK
jgi:GxxExxY protein